MVDELVRALERRRALGLPSPQTTAYRLLHGAADGLEGLTLDVYGGHLVASLYTESYGAPERAWLEAAHALGFEGVYLKQRPRQANELARENRRDRAPEHAILGVDAPPEIVVKENGQPFWARLGDGLSTGIFLDQRDNRARLAREAQGKSVLNLFAYTCAFGAVAAANGARETVNVDVAKSVLERGRKNYELAGVPADGHRFLARDVLETLPRMAQKGVTFELVVLDPPSYASTRGGRFSVERDYPDLVTLALALVADGGTLLACTNHQKLTEREVSRAVRKAAAAAGRRLHDVEFSPPPADHPPVPGRAAHLKSAWIRL
jgi:23S rRNA (cytosine1962-C5)-methyltransferase